jgi:hypothetical protein
MIKIIERFDYYSTICWACKQHHKESYIIKLKKPVNLSKISFFKVRSTAEESFSRVCPNCLADVLIELKVEFMDT